MNSNISEYKRYQELVAGKNINPQTLLATNYLNHFNEIHMLLGMIAEMPDCIDDIKEWEAISYQGHFKYSVFQDKDLAIEAFHHSPIKYKEPFEKCVSEMDKLLLSTIIKVKESLDKNDLNEVNIIVAEYTPKMERMIENCSAIINSKEFTSQQDVIDDYFDDDVDEKNNAQDAIDDLFS